MLKTRFEKCEQNQCRLWMNFEQPLIADQWTHSCSYPNTPFESAHHYGIKEP